MRDRAVDMNTSRPSTTTSTTATTTCSLSNGGSGAFVGRSQRRFPASTKSDFRFRKAVCRVLIALSFKSFRIRNEGYRKRERSDCSEAFFLPVVEEERASQQEDLSDLGRSRSCGPDSTAASDTDHPEDETEEEESEAAAEPSSPLPRRGRRQAICDSKSLGTEAGDLSPTASCYEHETSQLEGGDDQQLTNATWRRSSTELDMTSYPDDLMLSQVVGRKRSTAPLLKRNTIADFANTKAYQESTASLISASDQDRKIKNTFSILKLREKRGHRSKDNLPLADVLLNLKTSEFKDSHLIAYKDSHWSDLLSEDSTAADNGSLSLTETERKRREAVWELFRSECVFLIDHLMVLKHCFMEPLKKVQVEGHLMFAEPSDLFGNLDELCYVSYTFSRDFISLLLKDGRIADFGRTEILIKALRRFCQLTRDGEVYHDYCLNYSKAITYLEQLRRNDDFCEFEKWCGQDQRCHRLQLTDLLISPMQHCTKVPLLLNNIRRYTQQETEQQMLTESLDKLQTSLENLEAKMIWLKNFERVQEIQQQVIWQPITELEPRAFIPEFLRVSLSRQPCERLLSSSKRRLLHEGSLTLLEISKVVDMYLFLFDDILLMTKVKKAPRKRSNANEQLISFAKIQTDGAVFVVHRQPIALDRFVIHDVRPSDTSGMLFDYLECNSESGVGGSGMSEDGDNNYKDWCIPPIYDDCSPSAQKSNLLFGCVSVASVLKNAFVLVQVNRFQQIIGVFTLQAPTHSAKASWLSRLHEAQDSYRESTRRAESKRASRDCGGGGGGGPSIDITVQCENGSFLESPEDRTRDDSTSTPRPPNSLLGVPRGYIIDRGPYRGGGGGGEDEEDWSPDDGSRNRKMRSCSSDAAAALQQSEELDEAQTGLQGAGLVRRISDPLCVHRSPAPAPSSEVPTAAVAVSGGIAPSTGSPGLGVKPSAIEMIVRSYQHRKLDRSSSSSSSSYSTPGNEAGQSPSRSERESRGSFIRRHQRQLQPPTHAPPTMMTPVTMATSVYGRPQSLGVTQNVAVTSVPVDASVPVKSQRWQRATSLRLHRRKSQKKNQQKQPDSVYI